jgi:hypothetical protein
MLFAKSAKSSRLAVVLASSLCATTFAQDKDRPVELPKSDPPTPLAPTLAAASADPSAQPPGGNPVAPADAPAVDQTAPPPAAAAPADLTNGEIKPAPSTNVTINLINRMVAKGLLTKEEAAELINQAEQDAAIARTQAQADAVAVAQEVVRQAVATNTLPDNAPLPDDAVRVTYIPEIVKKQIRDEIRQDVMAKAKSENWVGGQKLPDWVSKFRVKGDIRLRYQGDYFANGNDNTGAFPNFNSINTGAPFDVSGTVFSPQLNVDEDRQRFRLRARIGAEVDLMDGFTAGLRIATGENNSPTSPNQSLGVANQGQGGNFSKYAIWLDRAFVKYEAGADRDRHLTVTGGRFDNPFFSSDIIYDEDLGFDGFAMQARYKVNDRITPFANVGAFPIFNTDFNFSSNQPDKFDSTDKYLYGAQLGADLKLTKNLNFKLGGAYYVFDGAEGEQSTPYTPLNNSDAGDTDNTRPSFAQKGNTYMPLRRIIPNANNNFGTTNQFQYFGLATKYQPMAFTGRLDYNGFEPIQVSLHGEYIKNLGFDRDRLEALGVNNRGSVSANGTPGRYAGGDTAWIIGLRAGMPAMQKRGDWQIGVNYRHIESDAVIDGFNESDFGLGGTNMKGFGIWGSYATSPNTALGIRWMSADQIAGPPLKTDLLQIDFTGRF